MLVFGTITTLSDPSRAQAKQADRCSALREARAELKSKAAGNRIKKSYGVQLPLVRNISFAQVIK